MLINATSLYMPLADHSVHAVMTSPPYYGLRKYKGEPQIWPAVNGQTPCPLDQHDWQDGIKIHTGGAQKDGQTNSLRDGRDFTGQNSARDFVAGATCAHCGAWSGHLGNEPTPALYVQHLVMIFREVRRVLRPDGTFWLNLGDSYAGSGKGPSGHNGIGNQTKRQGFDAALVPPSKQTTNRGSLVDGDHLTPGRSIGGEWNLKAKDLMGIPWRVAIALQDDGWWLRSDIIWHKPNCMPGSQDDRPTTSHEYIFLFSASADYFYDPVAIMEKGHYDGRKATKHAGAHEYLDGAPGQAPNSMLGGGHERWKWDVDGDAIRQKRDVWTVTTRSYAGALEDWVDYDFVRGKKPYRVSPECLIHGAYAESRETIPQALAEQKKGCTCPRALTDTDHYAAWPPDLVRPMILAGTSEKGVCPQCGAPYQRVLAKAAASHEAHSESNYAAGTAGARLRLMSQAAREKGGEYQADVKTLGWEAMCVCEADGPVPATVLDPFAGSGATGEVCREHRRRFVGLDIGLAYLENLAKVRAEGLTPKGALASLPMFAGMGVSNET